MTHRIPLTTETSHLSGSTWSLVKQSSKNPSRTFGNSLLTPENSESLQVSIHDSPQWYITISKSPSPHYSQTDLECSQFSV
ncbi:hypothetical protein Syun_015827 [Stephania yunnanensis]|uniref:Uncharacterized protein n=1 Tax=Stephania yunnanensis TaxID=152371 RepID=A0AAP0P382_9MAGN